MTKRLNKKLMRALMTVFLCGLTSPCIAETYEAPYKFNAADCRKLEEQSGSMTAMPFGDALLWEVRHGGASANYVFGTIHLSDLTFAELPARLDAALRASELFIMELLPTPQTAMAFREMAFYQDGRTLSARLDEQLFARASEILAAYQLPASSVAAIKPWGAFLTMSYPPDNTSPIDLKLYERARALGTKTFGLEDIGEQTRIFDELAVSDQMRLLLDALCNYDSFEQTVREMKRLYLNADLNRLMHMGFEHNYAGETLYQTLKKRLLNDRNQRMTERLQVFLRSGGAFVAVGALHLPGEDGILSKLQRLGYTIKKL